MVIRRILIVAACIVATLAVDASARRPAREPEKDMFPPGEPGFGMGGPRHGMMIPVTEEEEAQALAFLRRADPAIAERMDRLKETAPRRYTMTLRRVLMAQARLGAIAEGDSTALARHQEMFRLEAQVEDLALQYRESQDGEPREELRGQIETALSRLFDLREGQKREEMEHLEARLQHLRRVVEARQAGKDAIVERRLQQVLGEHAELEW